MEQMIAMGESKLPAGKVMKFRKELLSWGKQHMRVYEWRNHRKPYPILVSEFMLHRTRAMQAEMVYQKFMEKYPTLKDYSKANKKCRLLRFETKTV